MTTKTGTVAQRPDKYKAGVAKAVNCAERVHLCGAACCRFTFYLTAQDVAEGVVKYDKEDPYKIAQDQDGWCAHVDRRDLSCAVHLRRPAVCREYDCSSDARIWEDFDGMVINPNLWKSKESNHDGTITEGTIGEVVGGQDQGSTPGAANCRGSCRGCGPGKSLGLA